MYTLILILIPLLGSLAVLFFKNQKIVRPLALLISIGQLVLTAYTYYIFERVCPCNFKENIPWIPSLGINFHIALDGVGLLMVLLTNILFPLIILSGFGKNQERANIFYSLILLMQASLIGVFVSQNAILFYIFWELALIPIYFIVLLWGGERRQSITLKFFIYTLVGSLFMLVAFIYLFYLTSNTSFEIKEFHKLTISAYDQNWIFLFMFLAFAIKMPLFPFHTWQPDTYTTAPTQGSMLLSGIMLKMGIFGAIKWLLPIVPLALVKWQNPIIILSVIGVVYASFLAFRQKDLKRMIAYSSIAHVGLIGAGIFAGTFNSLQGVMVQMFAHGIYVVGLFYISDIIEERLQTRQIADLGGIRKIAGNFTILFFVIVLGSIALPLTNGFVGEFLLLLGIYDINVWYTVVGGLGMIMGAVYMLFTYQRIMLGESNKLTDSFIDIKKHEWFVLIPICILILFFGVHPQPLIDLTQSTILEIVKQINIIN
ncbi:MAG: NuoM family protein [Bacteroidia bacterium]|nr:NuoM family protein [Bacteroidia bacterium]